jgi:hypothetical protein
MLKPSILKENKNYTFADYFDLSYSTKEVIAELGYQFQLEKLALPCASIIDNDKIVQLKENLYKKLPYISLNSEMAKRGFLISPLLFLLLDYVEFDINVEYSINVNDRLKGNIDYLLSSAHNFIVVEAKNADLEKGFTQLAAELIAFSQYNDDENKDLLYGAVTVGSIWQFGMLDAKNKILHKDIDAFLVPSDLENLFAVLLGILKA